MSRKEKIEIWQREVKERERERRERARVRRGIRYI